MGSAMAGALIRGGARVVATLDSGSERTARLAEGTGLEFLPDLEAVVEASTVVLSIAPPEAALEIAGDIASAARRGRAAPRRGPERHRADDRPAARADRRRGRMRVRRRLDLGPAALEAGNNASVSLGHSSARDRRSAVRRVECIVVGDWIGDASAVKMSTASVYKGTTAVLTQALLAARANGVLEHVLADLERGAPELVSNPGRRVANGATKAARYVGEMREIAETQSRAGLTPALFEAMADVYELAADITRSSAPRGARERPGAEGRLDELAPLSGRRGEPLP